MGENIERLLKDNSYPGRGILLGQLPGGDFVVVYFIMGRSANSRNRVFVETSDGIATQPADPERVVDPSLIIYNPVREYRTSLIVTNGDQTDTIHNHLSSGSDFESALRTRTFEPDAPNNTPRISGIVYTKPSFSYKLSILKADSAENPGLIRQFFEYPCPQPGLGHFISTYRQDGDPMPCFEGEPVKVRLPYADLEEISGGIWLSLNEDNRVSLYVRVISAKGETHSRIINRFTQK